MTQIQSGATADLLTIDATSKAARVTNYDSGGNELRPAPSGAYMLPIRVRASAATAATATVWAMHNLGAKVVKIRKIYIAAAFDGTAAASVSDWQLTRFRTATPTGGSAIPVIPKKTSYGASSVTDARFLDTGLTVGAMTFDGAFAQIAGARQVGSSNAYWFVVSGLDTIYEPIELAINDGLCIRTAVAQVIGDSISGGIEWEEV